MPASPDPLDEFLRKVAPLLQSTKCPIDSKSAPIYKSLELSCIAVKQDSKGVIISGNLALSTRPYRPEARLQKVADIHEIIAMQGSLPAEELNEFLANLRDSRGKFSWMPPRIVKLPSMLDEMPAHCRDGDHPDPETMSRLLPRLLPIPAKLQVVLLREDLDSFPLPAYLDRDA